MASKVQVTQAILDGIVAVQESGETNMFDRSRVRELLAAYGYVLADAWVANHPQEYGRLILFGADVTAEEGEPEEGAQVQDIGA